MAKKEKVQKEKPLEKMTATELREVAKEIPEIVGAHGMNKNELVSAVKEARGIVDTGKKKSSRKVREIKKQIKDLKVQRQAALEANEKDKAAVYRRKISRLKKQTRRVA
ncbi:MAG TPA: Rho termination factor N-terminal domain-containing protein [Desulfobacterales bacterium]